MEWSLGSSFPTCFPPDFEVIKVLATDADQENTDNADIRYKIMSQDPKMPAANLFVINPVNGAIRVNAGGLDREVRLSPVLSPIVIVTPPFNVHMKSIVSVESQQRSLRECVCAAVRGRMC